MSSGKFRVMAVFALINLFGFSLLGIAYLNGWVELVIERDKTPISLSIAAVHVLGMALCFMRARQLNRAFDDLASDQGEAFKRYIRVAKVNASNATVGMEVILGRKLTWIKAILTILPTLGLLGTVVGIAMALDGSGVEAGADMTEVVREQYTTMTAGLSVAFFTTIVGVVFMLWTFINVKLLEIESMRLMEGVLEKSHLGTGTGDQSEDFDDSPKAEQSESDAQDTTADQEETSDPSNR